MMTTRSLFRDYGRDPILQLCAAVFVVSGFQLLTSAPEVSRRAPQPRRMARTPAALPALPALPVLPLSQASIDKSEWRVDASGAPGSDGKSIAELRSKLHPGDRVTLAPGEYHERLEVDFDLELTADPRLSGDVIITGEGGPSISHSAGLLRLTGVKLVQNSGDALVSRNAELYLKKVDVIGRGGRALLFERTKVRAEALMVVSETDAAPAVARVLDSDFSCSRCLFEGAELRASGSRARITQLEEPVFKFGILGLTGRAEVTVLGGTFLGKGSASGAVAAAATAEEDSNLQLSNVVFDRSGLEMWGKSRVDLRSTRFNAGPGPVLVAKGSGLLRLVSAEFSEGRERSLSVGPGVRVETNH